MSTPSQQDKDQFTDRMLNAVKNAQASDIARTAEAVGTIGKAFQDLTDTFSSDTFTELVQSGSGGFYMFFEYREEWKGYFTKWEQRKWTSYYKAEKNIDILTRFDTYCLAKIVDIKTENDRLEAMRALHNFIDENPDSSDETSRGFLELKRDIAAWIVDFKNWLASKGLAPNLVATTYKKSIASLLQEIAELNQKISTKQSSLAVAGVVISLFAISDPAIAAMQIQRSGKQTALQAAQASLVQVQQTPILQFLARMESWQADLDLLFDRMVVIGEVWSSVRSQAVQFKVHLDGGLAASTNLRFKSEVKLARGVCAPLITGLKNYMLGLHTPYDE